MAIWRIKDLFKSSEWSRDLAAKIGAMIELSSEMFRYAVGVVVYKEPDRDPQAEIYDKDQRINRLLQEIRRSIADRLQEKHTSGNVPTALIFMNVAKDAERIGDYMKNFYEISRLQSVDSDQKLRRERLAEKAKILGALFALTLKAFSESEHESAEEVIRRGRALAKDAEAAIARLAKSDLRSADAVCLTLSERFFKRIAMHMANIATTVVSPVDQMDHYSRPDTGQAG
jgi:phosphate transport system protein